jgi:hypothetical protein
MTTDGGTDGAKAADSADWGRVWMPASGRRQKGSVQMADVALSRAMGTTGIGTAHSPAGCCRQAQGLNRVLGVDEENGGVDRDCRSQPNMNRPGRSPSDEGAGDEICSHSGVMTTSVRTRYQSALCRDVRRGPSLAPRSRARPATRSLTPHTVLRPARRPKTVYPLAKYLGNFLDNLGAALSGVGIPSANRWTSARPDRWVIVLDAEQGTGVQWRLRVRPTDPGLQRVWQPKLSS